MTFPGTAPDWRAEWETACILYPLYRALARQCVIDVAPCPELESGTETPAEDSIEPVRLWFSSMDEIIQVHQLRHFLQTSALANDEILRVLLEHHLGKENRNESDRNKVDFLMVQLFSLRAPANLNDSELDLAYVAQVLEPQLGKFDLALPATLENLDALIRQAQNCKTLKELFTSRIIEQGRKMKDSCGDSYFEPIAMAAFTRSGFLLRRLFFRLLLQDLNAISDGLRELEARGVDSLDCRRAQFSAYEPLSRLRMICQSWKVMFHAEYASGQPLCLLVDLRTVVDAALMKTASMAHSGAHSGEVPTSTPKAKAAAAGAAQKPEDPNAFREWNRESSSSLSTKSTDDHNANPD